MSSLIIEQNEATRIIRMNRPSVYNALNREGKLEIIAAMNEAGSDPQVRSVILTAEGKAFCSGQDLNDRAEGGTPDLGHTLKTEWNPLMASVRDCPKVVIAAINGVCAGAGMSLALACDIRFSHPMGRFVSGFAKLGLCPDAGSSSHFTRALGSARALEFFLLNRPLEAAQMKEVGLLNGVSEYFLDDALAFAREINKMAPKAVQSIKANVKLAAETSFYEMIEIETKIQGELGRSADYQEGLAAFFEKRPPNFTGQ